MGKMSRQKGKVGEREVAALLREHGFAGQRGVQYQGGPDSADVIGLPGWHVEVKRTESLSVYAALDQAVEDSGDNLPVVFHRRNNERWVVILDAGEFLQLVAASREVKPTDHRAEGEHPESPLSSTVAREG